MDYVIPAARAAYGMYQQYSRGGRRGRSRRPQRRRKSAKTRNGKNNVRPPVRSLMAGCFNGSVRSELYHMDAIHTYYKTYTFATLVGAEYAGLIAHFTEIRINAVRMYIQPTVAITEPGSYTACLFDSDVQSIATPKWGAVMASPGSVTRRMAQPCQLHWKWTEPSDANFRPTTSSDTVAVLNVVTTSSGEQLSARLICDVSLTLRNQAGTTSEKFSRYVSAIRDDPLMQPVVPLLDQACQQLSDPNPEDVDSPVSMLLDHELDV